MHDKDRAKLETILEYCQAIERSLEKHQHSYPEYLSDDEFYDSLNMKIFQVGELSTKLSEEYKSETYEKIPWRDVSNMRNMFGHDYGSMDKSIIWQTATEGIPELQRFIIAELER